jgi:hypothetical protein
VWGPEYSIALLFSSFVGPALFIVRREKIGTQQPGTGMHSPSIHFVHFKRILNPEVEPEILVPNISHFSNFICNYPIQGQEGGTTFKKGFQQSV